MKTFLYFIAFAILVNFIVFEMIRQLNANDTTWPVIVPIELKGESLYDPPTYSKDHPEVSCMAENLYHEARGEGVEGKLAVALVTMNRVRHVRWPNSVCEVVYEPYQFSWTHQDVTIDPIEHRSWEQSQQIAIEVLNREHVNDMIGVTHYHATYVNSIWGLTQVAQVGNHVFYLGD